MEASAPSFESSQCWDNPSGSCTPRGSLDYGSLPSKLYLFYMFLVVTGALPKLIDLATRGRYTERLSKYVFREIPWAHGMATYAIMCVVQPRNLRLLSNYVSGALGTVFGRADFVASDVGISVLGYTLKAILAFILWDLLIKSPYSSDVKMMIFTNTHHLGLFIAMHFGSGWEIDNVMGPSDDASEAAKLDACLYGWMWAIHSFGLILKLFPLLGIEVREGERSTLLDNIKYAYSAMTVYWYYRYFNVDSQPGVGLNYQTMSLLTMLIGRFLPNFGVPFLRRVEMPGMFVVLVDGLFFKDDYLQRSVAVALSMLGLWAFYFCCLKKHPMKPAQFFGPEKNAKLKDFLESETEAVISKEEEPSKMREVCLLWLESTQINEKKHAKKDTVVDEASEQFDPLSLARHYPLHYAVVKGDVDRVEQLLREKKFDVNEPILEGEDLTPLQWVMHMDLEPKMVLALLKHGGNPYIKDNKGRDTIACLANAPLGNSQDFFERYNEICLEKSPPGVVFSELTVLEKLRMVPV